MSPPLVQEIPVYFRPINRHGFFLELVFLLYLLLGGGGGGGVGVLSCLKKTSL